MEQIAGQIARLRPALAAHQFAADAALAALLAALVLSDIATSTGYYTGPMAVYVAGALLQTVPLAFRRRAPLLVAVVGMGALSVEALVLGSAPVPDTQLVGWLLAVYSVAAHSNRRAAVVGGLVSLVAGNV